MKQFVFYKSGKTAHRFIELAKWPLRCLTIFALIALFAPLLANEKPLYVNFRGHHLFPAFGFENGFTYMNSESGKIEYLQYDIAEWKKIKTGLLVFPFIPYSPGKSDLINSDYVSPFGEQVFETTEGKLIPIPWHFRHYFGTGKTGDDVLAGLIHGTRISFFVSLLSLIISSLIGIILGATAGYFGDNSIKISTGQLVFAGLGLLPAFFYGFYLRYYLISDSFEKSGMYGMGSLLLSFFIFFLIMSLFILASVLLSKKKWFSGKMNFPMDSVISRIIEIFISLPRLIIIITIASIASPSFINLVLVLSLILWTDIARITRAELLRQRELDYILAARSLGYSNFRILFRHALPNSIGPVLVTIAFTAALAILIESSLSFLGIGVPLDVVTWGSLLASGKENINAWWLIVFPGIALFIIVMIYNRLGEKFRKALLHQESV